jgi:ATP-dependent DNA helicase RecG
MKETQHIEWKESWRDEYLRWICGFANAEGGVLVIGRNDKGEAVGVKDASRLLQDIPEQGARYPGHHGGREPDRGGW